MAKNSNDGKTRKGQVKKRSQVYNSKTKMFVKRGPDGKFISCKKDGNPYKSVRKETNKINKSNKSNILNTSNK